MGNVVDDIKNMMEQMDVSTARGRAEKNGTAIKLKPTRQEIETAARRRAGAYADMARELCEAVSGNRAGLSADELERVEFVREQLIDIARDVYVNTISTSQGNPYSDPF